MKHKILNVLFSGVHCFLGRLHRQELLRKRLHQILNESVVRAGIKSLLHLVHRHSARVLQPLVFQSRIADVSEVDGGVGQVLEILVDHVSRLELLVGRSGEGVEAVFVGEGVEHSALELLGLAVDSLVDQRLQLGVSEL